MACGGKGSKGSWHDSLVEVAKDCVPCPNVGSFTFIRPSDDADASQASDWADDLINKFTANGHTIAKDVDDSTPADTKNIVAAVRGKTDLICYFGHGDEHSWLTNSTPTFDASNVVAATGKAVVSVACKTGCNLGPAAITAGALAWLGFTIKVAIMAPHKNVDPIGDAIVDGLEFLANNRTMQEARDEISANFDRLVGDYDSGRYSSHPEAEFGYFAALSLRDHVVLHGQSNCTPLP
jgi:hypothetical protein